MDFSYRVPEMAGMGNHWPLEEYESKMLGKAMEGTLKALPKKSSQKLIKAISGWLPWVSLATTAYIITMPRIMQTMNQRRATIPAPTLQPSPNGQEVRTGTWEDVLHRRPA